MRAARKALRGAAERHGEGVPRWRGRSYLSVFVKTEKHTLALTVMASLGSLMAEWSQVRGQTKNGSKILNEYRKWRRHRLLGVKEDLDTQQCRKKANRIKDPYQTNHKLFCLLRSGQRYSSIRASGSETVSSPRP
ncbi:unnamed protein product [Pleuronectes platessa]|uniref:Uncharacterized protein n=1 Tax=Pleuronectes platessa TaxID=8262 RepID=A0A9N7Z6L0_PLEPL|nr:unnamed protein product [Pleuronectes platessa]